MADFLSRQKLITWRSPKGTSFTLKTNESGYKRKHIGEVKENPKTTYSSSVSKNSKVKGSKTSHSSGASTPQSTKVVGDSNDTFSDMGVSGRDISLECLFVGETHDIEAQKFVNALCEVGKSYLKLAYGEEFVVNVIDFELKNDLTRNINLTAITVNFHETTKTTYPNGETSGTKEVKNEAEKTNEIAAKNLETSVNNISEPKRLSKFATAYSGMMSNVSDKLSTANDISLNSIMTDIVGQNVATNALTMTSQMQIVMSKAASLAFKTKNLGSDFSLFSSVGSGMGAWEGLLSSLITSSTPTSGDSSLNSYDIDSLLINDVSATSALAALSQAAVEADFTTRKEAVEAATSLTNLEETWTNHIEGQSDKITDLGDALIRDSGVSDLVASASSVILARAYELKVERTIVLSDDKSVIDLAYEYYPDDFAENPDETISYLITSNKLSDEDFFILPKGTEIKIYV